MNELGFGVTTPVRSSESCPVLRPLSGSALSVVPEMTCPTVAVSVCSTGVSLVTSTVSSTAPSASLKSSRTICFASIWMGLVADVLKRDSSTFTMYVPTGRDETV